VGCTVLLTSEVVEEPKEDEIRRDSGSAICDGTIYLYNTKKGRRGPASRGIQDEGERARNKVVR